MRIRLKDIIKSYNAIKKLASEEFEKSNLLGALQFIDKAAILAAQFMWIYRDDELEDLIEKISKQIFCDIQLNYVSIEKKVVFYDDFCLSFILTLQYVQALSLNGYEIMYITPVDDNDSRHKMMLETIKLFSNITVHVVPEKLSRLEKIKEIHETILDFQPEKIFLHLNSFSISLPAISSLPSGISSYFINHTDHGFWLGAKIIDYSFEFRPFGATISLEKRNLKKEQLFLLPFYPIVDNNSFQGFPKECHNKVVIFSGGYYYKTIDKNNTYWNLVKRILGENSNAVFLLACKGIQDSEIHTINEFVTDNKFQNRFFFIGFRADINEVFKHCDIYMGTCPISGSLMSQYAAAHAKPILQFYLPDTVDEETESAICHNQYFSISYTNQSEFFEEARHLINDAEYRNNQGEKLRAAMMTKDQFNQEFGKILQLNSSIRKIEKLVVDYCKLSERWLELESSGSIDTISHIYNILGTYNSLKMVPMLYFAYNYRRYISEKLLNTEWYRYKLSKHKLI